MLMLHMGRQAAKYNAKNIGENEEISPAIFRQSHIILQFASSRLYCPDDLFPKFYHSDDNAVDNNKN
jgi:hypothetical protein